MKPWIFAWTFALIIGLLLKFSKLVFKFVLMEHLPIMTLIHVFKNVQMDNMETQFKEFVLIFAITTIVFIEIIPLICALNDALTIRACMLKIQPWNAFWFVSLAFLATLSIELAFNNVLNPTSLAGALSSTQSCVLSCPVHMQTFADSVIR